MTASLKMMAENQGIEGVKKNTIFKVDPRLIAEEENFNLRNYSDPEVIAHIEAFADSYSQGNFVPPLVVRVTDDGQIYPVEGHCRRRGVMLAIQRGADIPFVDCIQYRGNDAERVELMLRSAEGLRLKPLEMGLGFLRLIRMGHDSKSIVSKMSGKITANRVEQLVKLAEANHDVHQLVRQGDVSADVAIEAVREHGEKAGPFLIQQLAKAQAAGRKAVTKAVIDGPKIPPRVVTSYVSSTRDAFNAMSAQTRNKLAELMTMDESLLESKTVGVDATVMVKLLRAYLDVEEANNKAVLRLEEKRLKASQHSIPA